MEHFRKKIFDFITLSFIFLSKKRVVIMKLIYKELDKYPKRISRKQKNILLSYLENKLQSFGYKSEKSESRYFVKCINLETVNENAEVIIGAHYDTPTILPFHFEYLFRLFGHTRQIFMMFCLGIFFGVLISLLMKIDNVGWLLKSLEYTFYISFLSLLIPNWQNKNDNTSGVAALLKIAENIANNDNLKAKVKFVFFDNEELGLLGSMMQKRKWNKQNIDLSSKKFISIDCVARGEIPVIVYHTKNDSIAKDLQQIFEDQSISVIIKKMSVLPLSDNYSFKEFGGVNISWMNKSFIPGGYFIKNIHTPRDNSVEYDKIELVCDVVEKYLTIKSSAII